MVGSSLFMKPFKLFWFRVKTVIVPMSAMLMEVLICDVGFKRSEMGAAWLAQY